MPDQDPETPASPAPDEDGPQRRRSSRVGLTREQRRLLNTPRAAQIPAKQSPPAEAAPPKTTPLPAIGTPPKEQTAARPEPKKEDRPRATAAPLERVEKASRLVEMQRALLIIGALLLLGAMFYAGTKFTYFRYLIASHRNAAANDKNPDPYPNIPATELIKQALLAEKAGNWQDAVQRYMSAKRKDLRYRGILYRVGTMLYEHRAFDDADRAFERAIAFGEDVASASYLRGLIATRRRDLAAAEQYFEAAATAEPFVADYQYYSGEAFRLDLKPRQGIPFYEQAALLAHNDQDATVCTFKVRMARIEAAESVAVNGELAKKSAAGPLPVDWLMTEAALRVQEGKIEAARAAIAEARDAKAPGLFASCANDFFFKEAAKNHPELAEALQVEAGLQNPFPN